MASFIGYLKARYRQWRAGQLEKKILHWIDLYRPRVMEDLTLEGYDIVTTIEIGPRTAAALMSGFRRILIAQSLTRQQRRLTLAVMLMAIRRSLTDREPVTYYSLKLSDITSAEGPDDNRRWKDWFDALAYLMPAEPFRELESKSNATYLVQRVFDVNFDAVQHRRRQQSMHDDSLLASYLPDTHLTF